MNQRTTKAELLSYTKTQEQRIKELEQQQLVLFGVCGLLALLYLL